MYTPDIIWDRDGRIEFHSLESLEEHLDRLTDASLQRGMPLAIQIKLNEDTSLQITVGSLRSYVAYYSTRGSPLIAVSRGPWVSDEEFTFDYMGEESGSKMKYCVPIEDAREAVRQYVSTGERPKNIVWDVPRRKSADSNEISQ